MISRSLTISLTLILSWASYDFFIRLQPIQAEAINHNSQINSESQQMRVGVMAIRGVEITQKKWQPTLNYLNQKIPGYTFELIPLEFNTMEAVIADQKVDFVLPNPGMYVELEWVYGARRIATLQNLRLGQAYTQFGAVIFRRSDRNDIQDLKDLKHKTFMAVSEIAFGGWQMAWETLKEAGVDPYRQFKNLQFGGSHDAVVYAVRDGIVDAGTVRTDTLERMELEGKINREDFVILNQQTQPKHVFPFALSTKLYPEWPFAVMPHTPVSLAEKVAIALIEMPADHPAAKVGRYQGWTIPANYQPCHETLRNLRVRPYENWGKVSLSQVIYQYRYGLIFVGISMIGLSYGVVYLAERKRNEAELRAVNADLENRVIARTSELKQAKEMAETANAAKSEFLSNMSHELRTPLNGILGYAQILKRDHDLSKIQKDGLNIIYNCGNHLLTLINDILDLSKIEARKMELYPNDFYLVTFLDNIVELIKMRALEKDIFFKFEPDTYLNIGIHADEKRLRQILLNLLSNAVKFTDEGVVTLRVYQFNTELNQSTIRFEIVDTGLGMSPEQLKKIFLPFEQVGDFKRRAEGTGLGLAITRQLVEMMGGKLQVQSHLNQGSKFWFDIVFPILKDFTEIPASPPQRIISYEGKKRTILVVDDKVENRMVLKHILEPLGFEIILGENGQQEVDLTQQMKPDLILTDLVMPIKTGIEAVQEIRKLPEFKTLPIIAISASLMDSEQYKSRIIGCNDFLPKPVDEEKLLTLLGQYLELNWVYEPLDSLEDDNLECAKIMAIPSPEKLTQFYNLIKCGRLSKVQEQAEELQKNDPKYTAFVQKIFQLTEEFEIQKLQQFLQDCQTQNEIPPVEELKRLYELVMLGSMRKIQERATYLEEQDQKYIPFAQTLKTLAQNFQDEKIIAFVEQYLPSTSS